MVDICIATARSTTTPIMAIVTFMFITATIWITIDMVPAGGCRRMVDICVATTRSTTTPTITIISIIALLLPFGLPLTWSRREGAIAW